MIKEQRKSRQCFKGGEILPTNSYGDLEIVEYAGDGYYSVRFLDTGYVTKATACKIKAGKVKDKMKPFVYGIGYLGGSYYNGKDHKEIYQRWKKMLARCYSGNFDEYYGDCTVCDRWLNFQFFCEDFMNLPGYRDCIKGLELDKDGVVYGNRVYSPTTCQLIPHSENWRMAIASRGALAGGIIGGVTS